MECEMKIVGSILVTVALAATTQAQTLLQRTDVSHSKKPYHVSAIFLKDGWELWAFGDTRRQSLDIEVGRSLWSNGAWSFSGYGVVWPDSNKWFALPWVNYSSRLAGGALSANLAAYMPLNGGPKILFSDGSALIWRNTKGNGIGVSASYWGEEGMPASLRVGPQVELTVNKSHIKLYYQFVYVKGSGKPGARLEVTQRL